MSRAVSLCSISWRLFGDNFDVDLSLNLFVEIDGGGEGTDFLQFGTVDHDFLTVDFVVVLLFQSLGNLLGSDGAEEVAILTHFGSEVDSLLVDGSLHGESLIAEFLFLTSALADVLGQNFAVARSGDDSHALGEKIVVGVSVLDFDDIVFVTKVGHILQKYNFHSILSYYLF